MTKFDMAKEFFAAIGVAVIYPFACLMIGKMIYLIVMA